MNVLRAAELNLEGARARFDAMATRDFADIPISERWLVPVILLAEACIALGDERRAETLYELLLPYRSRVAAVLVLATHFGAVGQVLGLLATLLARWDDAEAHFAEALALNERMGLRPFAAHTRHAWAAMLVKRGRRVDLGRARELNCQALETALEIGMVRLQRMAEALMPRLGPAETATPAHPFAELGVSPREAEVFGLLVTGKTNREIAEDLFLSVRTVDRHVENLYRKLDVHNRAEAVALALSYDGH